MYNNYNQQQYPPYNYQSNPSGPPPPQWQAPPRRSGGWGDPRLQNLGGTASPSPSPQAFGQGTYGAIPGPPPGPPPPPPSGQYAQQPPPSQPFDSSQWGVKYNQGQQYLPVEQAPALPPRPGSSAGQHEPRPQDTGHSNTPWQRTGSPHLGQATPQQNDYYQFNPQTQWSQSWQPQQDPNVPPLPPPRPPEYQGQQTHVPQAQKEQHGSFSQQQEYSDPFAHDPYTHHKPSHHYEPPNPQNQYPHTAWTDLTPQRLPSTRSEGRMTISSAPSVSVVQHGHGYSYQDAAQVSPIEPESDNRLHASALGSGGNPSDWELYAPESNESKIDDAPPHHAELPSSPPTQTQQSHSPRQSFTQSNEFQQEKARPKEPISTIQNQKFQEGNALPFDIASSSQPVKTQRPDRRGSQYSDKPDLAIKRADTIDGVIDAWSSPLRIDKLDQEPRRSSPAANRHSIAIASEDAPRVMESVEDRPGSRGMPSRSQSTIVTKVEDPYADLEPEYRASLKRYVAMLRREAAIEEDEEKFKIFQSFVTKELRLRSILYGVEMPELVPKQQFQQMQETIPPPPPQPSVVPYEVVKATKAPTPPPPPPPPALDQLLHGAQSSTSTQKDIPLDHDRPTPDQQTSTLVAPTAMQQSQTPDIPRAPQPSLQSPPQGPPLQDEKTTQDSVARTHPTTSNTNTVVMAMPREQSNSSTIQQMPKAVSAPQMLMANNQPPVPMHHPSPAGLTDASTSTVFSTAPNQTSSLPVTTNVSSQPTRPLTPPRLVLETAKQTESPKSRDGFVVVNAHNTGEDDVEYSPGGRPRLPQPQRQDSANQSKSSTHGQVSTLEQGPPSPGANAPMVIEDYVTVRANSPPRDVPIIINNLNADAKPIEFHPPRPVYTPFRYVEDGQAAQPLAAVSNKPADEAYSTLRKEAIDSNRLLAIDTPAAVTPMGGRKEHEEAFIGLIRSQSKLIRKKNSSISGLDALRVGTPAGRSESVLKKANTTLRSALPASATSLNQTENAKISAMKSKLEQMPDQFGFIHDRVVSWDRANRDVRRRLDEERRMRQEDSEAHIDGLFHDNEIGYADIGVMEEEFKLAEAERKYREDQDELDSFIQKVYNHVTERLERDIGEITTQYTLAVDMLDLDSDALSSFFTATNERVMMTSIMETVLQIYNKLEIRYQKIAEAHHECERRRKRVELTVLYTNGDTAGVRKLEQEFQVAEKMQILQDARNKDTRANKLMDLFDRAIARGLGDNQTYIDDLLAKTKSLNDLLQKNKDLISPTELFTPDGPRDTLSLVQTVSDAIITDSHRLLTISNHAEKILNDADYSVSVAEARVAQADEKTYAKLETEKTKEDAKIVEEIDSRISSVSKSPEELSALVKEMMGKIIGDDPDHKLRIKKSLEAARLRNAGKDKDGALGSGVGGLGGVPE